MLALEHGPAIVALTPGGGGVRCELRLDDLRDLTAAVARCRRLLDLDADPAAIAAHLGEDPCSAPLVRRAARAARARLRRRLRARGAGDRRAAGVGGRRRARSSAAWWRSTASRRGPRARSRTASPVRSRSRTPIPRRSSVPAHARAGACRARPARGGAASSGSTRAPTRPRRGRSSCDRRARPLDRRLRRHARARRSRRLPAGRRRHPARARAARRARRRRALAPVALLRRNAPLAQSGRRARGACEHAISPLRYSRAMRAVQIVDLTGPSRPSPRRTSPSPRPRTCSRRGAASSSTSTRPESRSRRCSRRAASTRSSRRCRSCPGSEVAGVGAERAGGRGPAARATAWRPAACSARSPRWPWRPTSSPSRSPTSSTSPRAPA